MKLYIKPGACSLSPHIALEESGLDYETETVDLKTKRTKGGEDFNHINPKGYVPALLLDSGELLTEGPAILQYVADQAPAKKLAPANGTIERYRLQAWLNFIATELHKSCTPFFNPASGDEWKKIAGANLERRLGYVDEQLADKPYLLGEAFSVADGYLFTVLSWMPFIKIDLSKWANLTAFVERVSARPAVQAVLKTERLG
ncbi:MAG TPA: glutathione transferase GstA [Rhodocyclaceae bacterium]|nr:glutathione transferase GstA [Rhodocyclaceae bacterium]